MKNSTQIPDWKASTRSVRHPIVLPFSVLISRPSHLDEGEKIEHPGRIFKEEI